MLRMKIQGNNRKEQGFTLIEVMVVVVILSILAVLVAPKIMSRPDAAKTMKARQDIRALEEAVKLYRLDNYSHPSTEQGLDALVSRPSDLTDNANWKTGGYVERLYSDPWGKAYNYLSPGAHGEVDIYTYGADGVAGGEGINADIGNWDLN
ncbi:MAG: type II secretion system major pseudopilin GspG [Candidatus Sedimenticola endophacoides]